MATPNRFALRDAGECTFYNLQTGKAIVTLSTIKTASMEFSGETSYARGGFGNPKLVGFSSNKEGTLSLSDALFDAQALRMLTGNELAEGVRKVRFYEVKAVTSNKLDLSKTPQGALISVFKVRPDGTNGEEFTLGTPTTNAKEYSITSKQLTFHSTVANGTQFRVYYFVNTAADAKTMKVTSDAFGGTFRVVMDVLVRDSYDGKDYAAQIEIPRGKFEENFSLSLSVDSDPAVLDLPIEMMNDPVTNELWTMTIYDADDII